MLISNMVRFDGPTHLMVVSDLDHTMVDHDDHENHSLLRFNALWEACYRRDSILVFSTGRSPSLYTALRTEKPLLTPDITIMSVGTEITYGELMMPDKGWINFLNNKWDRNIVMEETSRFPHLKLQPYTEQRPHKVSFYIEKEHAEEVMKTLSARLEGRGLDIKIIYSGGMDLDILPEGAGKGKALAYLLKKFEYDGRLPLNTLVCGDSGNDAELFSVPNVRGVMVSNAQEELLHWRDENARENPNIIHATERCAAGIIQAIGHFKLGTHVSPRDVIHFSKFSMENPYPECVIVKFYFLYERWRKGEVANEEQHLHNLKMICHQKGIIVHPTGRKQYLHDCIEDLNSVYGDKQGMQFSIWLDRVYTDQVGSGIWLVKFDKWEESGEQRHCCLITALLSLKDEEANQFIIVHMHETWLEGHGSKEIKWFF